MLEVNETANIILDYAVTSLPDKSGKLPLPHEILYKRIKKDLPHPVKGKTEMVVFSDNDSVHVQVRTGSGVRKSDSYNYSYNSSSGKNVLLPDIDRPDTFPQNHVYTISSNNGGKKIVSSYSYYDVVDNLKELDSLHKKQMVNRVMDKMILDDRRPIEKRITGPEIDSLLKINFKNYGISIDYNFGVITQLKDSTKLVLSTTNEEALRRSDLKALLYPSDIYPC